MARLTLYGDRPDAFLQPCYGGPPVRFRLRGLGWVQFFFWMLRYQMVWGDVDLTFVDGHTGKVVDREERRCGRS